GMQVDVILAALGYGAGGDPPGYHVYDQVTRLKVEWLGADGGIDTAATNAAGQQAQPRLGKVLDVVEVGVWEGRWVCRQDGKTYDAYWKNRQTGQEARDIIVLESIQDSKVVLYRQGNHGRYYGYISADGRKLTGTASWYQQGMTWSADISR
ncbi:MAG: hypothetical protein JXQ27_01430, partial [Acidobacteria bacterium]|nr:hypothetical protein [Acidobacteriota bacterium]